MTEINMALLELLHKHGLDNDVDFLREGIRLLSQLIMELEVSEQVGAGLYERNDSRQTQRTGYPDQVWETRLGKIRLRIPKVRSGAYFPSLLNPRRHSTPRLCRCRCCRFTDYSVVYEETHDSNLHP
jgi:transposase-like protein